MNKMHHRVFLLAGMTSLILSSAGRTITTPCLEPSKSIEYECTVKEQTKPIWKRCCTEGQAMMIDDGWKCGYCDQYHLYRCGYCVPAPDGFEVCAEYHTNEQVYCRKGECLRMGTPGHPTWRCKGDKYCDTDDDVDPTNTTLEATSTTVSTTESPSTTLTGSTAYPTLSKQPTIIVINGSTTSINNTHTNGTKIGEIIGVIIGGIFLVAVVVCIVCNRNNIMEFIRERSVWRWLCNHEPHGMSAFHYSRGRRPSSELYNDPNPNPNPNPNPD